VTAQLEAGLARLLDDVGRLAASGSKRDHAVALRVLDMIGEDGGAARLPGRLLAERRAGRRREDVVAEDQGDAVGADEVAADDEGLGQPLRASAARRSSRLMPERAAVAEQGSELGQIVRVEMINISRIPASIRVASG
jgi:hypothetical protein